MFLATTSRVAELVVLVINDIPSSNKVADEEESEIM